MALISAISANTKRCVPKLLPSTFLSCRRTASSGVQDPDGEPMSSNDSTAPLLKNRNPMNLEKMRIAYKPEGFVSDRKKRHYWNSLHLSVNKSSTTASVRHWTGRQICSASTNEWAIQKFLYNMSDLAAVRIVGKVLGKSMILESSHKLISCLSGQRCLETGISEVTLNLKKGDLEHDKMKVFIETIKETGLSLEEGAQFQQNDPFKDLMYSRGKTRVKPWEIVDE